MLTPILGCSCACVFLRQVTAPGCASLQEVLDVILTTLGLAPTLARLGKVHLRTRAVLRSRSRSCSRSRPRSYSRPRTRSRSRSRSLCAAAAATTAAVACPDSHVRAQAKSALRLVDQKTGEAVTRFEDLQPKSKLYLQIKPEASSAQYAASPADALGSSGAAAAAASAGTAGAGTPRRLSIGGKLRRRLSVSRGKLEKTKKDGDKRGKALPTMHEGED